jgi:hypothetical protein
MAVRYLSMMGVMVALWMSVAGCADTSNQPTTQPLTLEQRNQKIINDPMSVGPTDDPNYVTQHGLGADPKPTLKQDVNNFLNP